MKQFLTLILATCLISSCGNPPAPSTERTDFFAFGTVVSVTTEKLNPSTKIQLNRALQQTLNEQHHRWHAWQPSQLSRIQQACAQKTWLTLDEDVTHLVEVAQLAEKQSQGYFNPAAGELVNLWGFFSSEPGRDRLPPSAEAIEQALKHQSSTLDLQLQGNRLRCLNPHLQLDFGGFAKGYGIAELASILKKYGIDHALINAGGDIMTLGTKPDSQPWTVALENPLTNKPAATLFSEDSSVFTSGTSARRFIHDGQEYHHVINPKTGYPSKGLRSVTVISNDPTNADVAATALLAAGEHNWQALAQAMQLNQVAALDDSGQLWVTAKMRTLLKPAQGVKVIQVPPS